MVALNMAEATVASPESGTMIASVVVHGTTLYLTPRHGEMEQHPLASTVVVGRNQWGLTTVDGRYFSVVAKGGCGCRG